MLLQHASNNLHLCLQVKNMSIVDALLLQPFHTITHPTYGTIMRMMDDEVAFDIGVEEHVLSL